MLLHGIAGGGGGDGGDRGGGGVVVVVTHFSLCMDLFAAVWMDEQQTSTVHITITTTSSSCI